MQYNFTYTYCIKFNLMWHRTYVRFEALAGWLGEPSTRMVAGFSPRRSEMWDSQVVPTDGTTLGRVLRYFGIGAWFARNKAREERIVERDDMSMEVFLFLWEDSCRMVAHMEGKSMPEHFGMDDIECMASDRQVSIHTILLAVQYYELGQLSWE